jgi:3-hydroxyacyl-CoA dehydrogenase / enoyl-CoA hydratase / 3-hydroxybutyryl-CoA epimerase
MNQIVMGQYKHWQATQDDNLVVWLTLDRNDKPVNSLNEEVMKELDQLITSLENNDRIKAIIIRSGKDTGFIAGADIEQFDKINSAEEATKMIRAGQEIFTRIEKLKPVTIAMIEGFCLGGGLELALSCDYRIALNNSSTRIGLPEVKLGIHPGWGGCVRLPDLVGAFKAMDLILSGRMLRAKVAKRMGVVNEAVPKRLIGACVEYYALNKGKPKGPTWKQKWTNHSFARPLLSKLFEFQLKKKIKRGHYPSPFKVVDNWKKFGTKRPLAMDKEASSIGKLVVSATSQNLVKVFFQQEHLKGLAKKSDFSPKHVHVIGAGVMGGDIAGWCAIKGFNVTVQDQTPQLIGQCIKRTHDLAKKRLKEKHLVTQVMDRLMPDPQGAGIKTADVIIEAITEKLEAKQGLFKTIEAQAKPDAILATNTSTIPLEEIGTALKDPSRLVGIHFFNPVSMMPLVEVVHGVKTSLEVKTKALGFVGAIDKLPIPVKSAPGFLVNRILIPYMLEAVLLLEEGIDGPTIDKAAKDFGMPMGPIELGDTVGLDVCLAACEKLSTQFGIKTPDKLREYVAKGHLGRKSGQGFYTWKKGKAQKPKSKSTHIPDDIVQRLIYRMLNEAIACLREGIVDSPELLDAGSIFGFGFPPFRGGVLQYAKTEGFDHILEQLNNLQTRYGERFLPDTGWEQHVA